MVDIFQEVDEALQQDKLKSIWDEYKNTIIAAIVVLIGSTGASSFYQSWDQKRDNAETAALLQAVDSSNPTEALADFSKDTRRGHAVVAQMNKAALLLEQGGADNKKAAADIYVSIAHQKSAPDDFRDLSRILAARHNTESADIEKLLKPLIKNEKSPFHWHARLEAATYYANIKSDTAKALELLEPFTKNALIPDSLKGTGAALHHVYSQKMPKEQNNNEAS